MSFHFLAPGDDSVGGLPLMTSPGHFPGFVDRLVSLSHNSHHDYLSTNQDVVMTSRLSYCSGWPLISLRVMCQPSPVMAVNVHKIM